MCSTSVIPVVISLVQARKPVFLKKGKGKVFEYEDLEQSRIQRDAKDKAAAEKGKRTCSRKRKAATQDVQEDRPLHVRKDKVDRRSEDLEPVQWKAPVAKMY
ncbi:hypothetical protein ST47_g5240 [Ascochyta rabiei]|uniref:Uncharacterized protein n=1 Tax=Didymella rabiei TaxID=5454 RepID=A0A163EBS5_DIDRA|nr:hypothetical protein ST47_g5240 [Ascochyta rabiei]